MFNRSSESARKNEDSPLVTEATHHSDDHLIIPIDLPDQSNPVVALQHLSICLPEIWMLITDSFCPQSTKMSLRATCQWMYSNITLSKQELKDKTTYDENNNRREKLENLIETLESDTNRCYRLADAAGIFAYTSAFSVFTGGILSGMTYLFLNENNSCYLAGLILSGAVGGAISGCAMASGVGAVPNDENNTPDLSASLRAAWGAIVGGGMGVASSYVIPATIKAIYALSPFHHDPSRSVGEEIGAAASSIGAVGALGLGASLVGCGLWGLFKSAEMRRYSERVTAEVELARVNRDLRQ